VRLCGMSWLQQGSRATTGGRPQASFILRLEVRRQFELRISSTLKTNFHEAIVKPITPIAPVSHNVNPY